MFEFLRREKPLEELEPHRTVKRYVKCEDKIRLYFFDDKSSPVMYIDEFFRQFKNYNWIGKGREIYSTREIPFLFLGKPVTLDGSVVYFDNGSCTGLYAPKIGPDLELRVQ